jgi:hypothetical protein
MMTTGGKQTALQIANSRTENTPKQNRRRINTYSMEKEAYIQVVRSYSYSIFGKFLSIFHRGIR